ncbi:hypothetical protein CO050_06015 [Candidatus Roizmanbacteria bacterium CG_4_9_14_0_2_um_filter_38_17]|nr:MAG: hypothetical protein CO050_06015 [Candidatus Roizmanbacteria bacterium CG_4_9_14_0_2_um_filter_38_17]
MELFNYLLAHNYTKSDLLESVRLLRQAAEKDFYSSDGKARPVGLLPTKLYKDFTKEDLYSKIKEYTKKIKELPELTLLLPFIPDEPNLAMLTNWLRKEINTSLLVNIKLDAHLGAGCAFIIDGVYHDYSITKDLKKYEKK